MDFMERNVIFNVDTVDKRRYVITVMDPATMGVNLTLTELDVIVSVNENSKHGLVKN